MQPLNTANSAFSDLRPAVGQLAKTPFPTLKLLPAKQKAVGRHAGPFVRTSAHTREREARQGFHKVFSIKIFLSLTDLLYPQTKTVFHNTDYVASISEIYRKEDRELFFRLVRAFTLLRKSARHQPIEGVFETSDEDFLTALRLMKLRSKAVKRNHCKVGKKTVSKVLDYLHIHCQDKPFTSPLIARKLNIQREYVTAILRYLLQQNRIEIVCTEKSGLRTFRLKP